MEELNPSNAFGELLLDLITEQYEGNMDAGISSLMQTTGLSEEEVVAIVQGDFIVEEESLLGDIIAAFPDADDDDIAVIVQVAQGVDEEDRNELIAQLDADEAEMGMSEDMDAGAEVPAGVDMSAYVNTANFQAQRLEQLENHIVNFEAKQQLNSSLENLHNVASQLVANGQLPPSYKSMLIGNFSDGSQRMAKFSQIAAENGVDVPTMLFATQYCLGMLADASNYVEFRDYSATDEDVAIANFNASLTSVASADLDAIFNG